MEIISKTYLSLSHAAAYAVVSYQTAYLKYYHPIEFMAALMTSVIDNPPKVSEYIYASRQMGIRILPPDVNKGQSSFTVDGGNIRYGLAAIKSIGRPVIAALVAEREENGEYRGLEDFIERLMRREVLNKRAIENLIKAGSLDCFDGTRQQLTLVYAKLVDKINQEKKYSMSGQMSLFDIVDDEQKKEFAIQLPKVGEYKKEVLLAFEKEVLGVYISGHPLEEYEERWRKSVTATTIDFQRDEETNRTKVRDGAKETIGGMIVARTIKHTKTNQMMAFLTVEDLLGTVEVVVFPRDYERNRKYLEPDSKVFVRGRVAEEDERPSKLICERIVPFDQMKKELWIQFADKQEFHAGEQRLYELIREPEGEDVVVIYCKAERAVKRLPANRSVRIEPDILSRLKNYFGEERVKVLEKSIENTL